MTCYEEADALLQLYRRWLRKLKVTWKDSCMQIIPIW